MIAFCKENHSGRSEQTWHALEACCVHTATDPNPDWCHYQLGYPCDKAQSSDSNLGYPRLLRVPTAEHQLLLQLFATTFFLLSLCGSVPQKCHLQPDLVKTRGRAVARDHTIRGPEAGLDPSRAVSRRPETPRRLPVAMVDFATVAAEATRAKAAGCAVRVVGAAALVVKAP